MKPTQTNDTSGSKRDWTQHDKLQYHKVFAQCASHLRMTAMTTFWTASWEPEWKDEMEKLKNSTTAAAESDGDDTAAHTSGGEHDV